MTNPTSTVVESRRRHAARAGVQVELATVGWMTVEAVVAIAAGILARSVALTTFGLDSVLELVTGGMLLWRLATEARGAPVERVERAERRAAWITGVGLAVLCIYVLATSAIGLWSGVHASGSRVGIGLALVALLVMPLLAWRKRDIAAQLGSVALRGDAACSVTCAYLAGMLLVGLILNAALGWWWADSLAALALLYWLVPEAREALEGARAGRGACACGDDQCNAEGRAKVPSG
jgi:divalent metal cation (Fe/Co/Zn/Cd) transporter